MYIKCYRVFREHMSQKDKFWLSSQSYWLSWAIRPDFFWIVDKKKKKLKKTPNKPKTNKQTKQITKAQVFHFFTKRTPISDRPLSFTSRGVRVFWECRRKLTSLGFSGIHITFRQCRRTPLLIFSGIMIFSGIVVQFSGKNVFSGKVG